MKRTKDSSTDRARAERAARRRSLPQLGGRGAGDAVGHARPTDRAPSCRAPGTSSRARPRGRRSARGWLDAVHPDDRAASGRGVRARQRQSARCVRTSNTACAVSDGSYRWVIDSGRPRFGPQASSWGASAPSSTSRSASRSSIDTRRGEEQLELLSDTVPALISYVGTDRRYKACNAEYSKWFGLSREEIVGKTMREVLGADAWRVVEPHLARCFAGKPSEYEADVEYRHGGKRSIHARYTPHRDVDGAVVGVVCLVTDVTARRRARTRPRTTRRDRRLVRRRDHQQESRRHHHELEQRRRALVRLLGRGSRRSAGDDADSAKGRRHEEEKIIARIRHGEMVTPYETVRRRKDGSLLDVSLSVSPIVDEGGRIVGASKIARDITRAQTRGGRCAARPRGAEWSRRPRAVRHLHRRFRSSRSCR